jgi:WD40 repeat protein
VAKRTGGAVLRGHSGGIAALAAHPSGQFVASGSDDGCVKVWDIDGGGECVATLARHPRGVTALAFHPAGEVIASGGRDGVVGIWRWKDGKMVAAFKCGEEVTAVHFSRGGEFAAVAAGTPLAVLIPVARYVE